MLQHLVRIIPQLHRIFHRSDRRRRRRCSRRRCMAGRSIKRRNTLPGRRIKHNTNDRRRTLWQSSRTRHQRRNPILRKFMLRQRSRNTARRTNFKWVYLMCNRCKLLCYTPLGKIPPCSSKYFRHCKRIGGGQSASGAKARPFVRYLSFRDLMHKSKHTEGTQGAAGHHCGGSGPRTNDAGIQPNPRTPDQTGTDGHFLPRFQIIIFFSHIDQKLSRFFRRTQDTFAHRSGSSSCCTLYNRLISFRRNMFFVVGRYRLV